MLSEDSGTPEAKWFYMRHRARRGPVYLGSLQNLARRGRLNPADLVWHEGLAEWVAAWTVPDLKFPVGRFSQDESSDEPTGSDRSDVSPTPVPKPPRVPLRRRSPLVVWLLYATVLGAVLALTAGRYLVDAIRYDTTGLCLFISCIFGLAVLKSFADVLFFSRQLKLADRQVRQLWDTGNIGRFLDRARPSIFRQHIANLHQIFRRHPKVDQDNLLVFLQNRLAARTRIVDLCSSLLITLGLVGTIIGLIASVAGLSQVVANVEGESELLLEGMRDTLGGMGTAFYTTLLGAILGGVVLRILGNVVEEHLDTFLAHLGELAEIHILPILRSAAREREEQRRADRESTE